MSNLNLLSCNLLLLTAHYSIMWHLLRVWHRHLCNCPSNSCRRLFDLPHTSSSPVYNSLHPSLPSKTHTQGSGISWLRIQMALNSTPVWKPLGGAWYSHTVLLFNLPFNLDNFMSQVFSYSNGLYGLMIWKRHFSSLFFSPILLSLNTPRAWSTRRLSRPLPTFIPAYKSLYFITASLAHLFISSIYICKINIYLR